MDLKFSDIFHQGFGKPERVYLFHGPEDALKRKAVEAFAAAFVDKDTLDFDFEVADGAECSAERLTSAAFTAPIGDGRRLIVVNYANGILVEAQVRLAEAISEIPEASTIIFVEPRPESAPGGQQPKKRYRLGDKLRNAIAKVGVKVEFPMLKTGDAKSEAQRVFQQHGKKVSPAVLEALVRRVGEDIYVLRSEIDKVIHFIGERRDVTVEDVVKVTSPTPEERIWGLVDAIGARNVKAALRALEDVFEAEGNPESAAPRILAMIARQLRLIWQMRLLLDGGIGDPTTAAIPDRVAALLPADPNLVGVLKRQRFNTGRYRAQAEQFSPRDLVAAFERILQADLALKGIASGPRDPRMVLELLTVDLCGERRTWPD